MSADTLTLSSRAFFERSKMKVAVSIISSAFGLMLLAFCASVGGQASSAHYAAKPLSSSSHEYDAQQALQGGFGAKLLLSDAYFYEKIIDRWLSFFSFRLWCFLFYIRIHHVDCRCNLYIAALFWQHQRS